ncbi:MAG: class I SAM-dependent methyltransferase [Magnetococcales bacterium]|nr:class I SAM-dependent methyltransferase [Magnetococcales bacterium]
MESSSLELIDRLLKTIDSLIAVGDLKQAEELCNSILAKDINAASGEFLYLKGLITLKNEHYQDAVILLTEAVNNNPTNKKFKEELTVALMKAGQSCQDSGSFDEARNYYRCTLMINPNHEEAPEALVAMDMSGDYYLDVLEQIHIWLKPTAYLEIGVSRGESMTLAKPPTFCVGIDPTPLIKVPFHTQTELFKIESDRFFAEHDLPAILEGRKVDLSFIDGLHTFEQVFRDFINVESYCHPDTIIVLHDCLPSDPITSARNRISGWWTGDVWKVLPCLMKYRPDLAIIIIPAPPSGLAIITRLDPESTLLEKRYNELVEEFQGLTFKEFEKIRDESFNLVTNEWETIEKHIKEARTNHQK